MTTKIENALITGTTLGLEDHGIFSAYVAVEGEGWGVSFGGYALDQWDESEKRRIGTVFGMEFIAGVMHAVGVQSWEALKGKHCRIETEGWGGRALRIGHITKNQWFDPAALAAKCKAAELLAD